MRNIITIVLLMVVLTESRAQSSNEKLINDIYSCFVDTSYSSYYLHEKCLTLKRHSNENKGFESFMNFISETQLDDLLNKATTDTLPLKWNCGELDKAKCINKTNNTGILIVELSHYPSKRYRKKIEKENDKINKKPEQERRLYYFSRPIIDNKSEYAIIEMKCAYASSYYDTYFNCVFLLKNLNGQWTKIAEAKCFGM
jgi:hypothetical protein